MPKLSSASEARIDDEVGRIQGRAVGVSRQRAAVDDRVARVGVGGQQAQGASAAHLGQIASVPLTTPARDSVAIQAWTPMVALDPGLRMTLPCSVVFTAATRAPGEVGADVAGCR